MASSSSSPSSLIVCASFNQDNSCFAIGTKDGFKIFDSRTGRLCYERAIGTFSIVEMLYTSNLLAIVGAGEQRSLSPRRLCLFNTISGTSLRELNFLTSVLAVRMNRKRLIVVLQDKAFVYDLNSLAILDTVDTIPNPKGLCAFSPSSEGCYLALPASTTKGSVLVYNTMELQSLCQIDAHRSPLAAVVFSSNGMYLATASEQGTIVRVHLVSQATKSYSFRRGTYSSTIYSLSFGPSLELPDILVAASSTGSLHVFFLDHLMNERKPTSLLSSLIPDTMAESTHHHVVHNAVAAGVKSHMIVHSVAGKIPNASSLRASIFIITHNGFFQEYILNVSKPNESSWSMERELNLLNNFSDIP